jgi:hypothetical protein
VDFYHIFGYLSGLLLIKPDIDGTTLIRTGALVHILDAILCMVIAGHSSRQRLPWTLAGVVFGIWALGALFLLPTKTRGSH